MEKQLSFELDILSSKQKNSSLKKHLSNKRKGKSKQEQIFTIKSQKNIICEKNFNKKQFPVTKQNQKKQPVSELLPKTEKESKLDFLSLERVKSETSSLKEIALEQNPRKELIFENLISVKIVAERLGLAPKTIHNWVHLRKIPYVKFGKKVMFRPKSLKAWLNRKEIKSWL